MRWKKIDKNKSLVQNLREKIQSDPIYAIELLHRSAWVGCTSSRSTRSRPTRRAKSSSSGRSSSSRRALSAAPHAPSRPPAPPRTPSAVAAERTIATGMSSSITPRRRLRCRRIAISTITRTPAAMRVGTLIHNTTTPISGERIQLSKIKTKGKYVLERNWIYHIGLTVVNYS